MATCPNGHYNADGAGFCASCGAAISSQGAPPPPMPPAPPAFPPSPYGQQPGYGQPPYGQPYGAAPQNGFGTAALVLGIISLVCVSGYGVLSVLAIIFGALGLGRANRGLATNRGMAMAGLIMGIIGLVIGAIVLLIVIANSGSSNYRY